MPRPTRSHGRPGTQVIPTDWATSHRPVVRKTWTATVELRHPGTTQDFSNEAQQMVETPQPPYYQGPARIQELDVSRGTVQITAGDREVVAQYLVVIDADVAPASQDLCAVTGTGDAVLDGKSLLVGRAVGGSLRWERDLFCTLTD